MITSLPSNQLLFKLCKNRFINTRSILWNDKNYPVDKIDMINGIEMIENVINMENEKQKVIEEKEFCEGLLMLEEEQWELYQNEQYKKYFRANILRCVRDKTCTFLGFTLFPHYEKCILKSEFPLNYNYTTCSKFRKIQTYLGSHGITILNKVPIKKHMSYHDTLTGIYIRYDPTNKLITITEEEIIYMI